MQRQQEKTMKMQRNAQSLKFKEKAICNWLLLFITKFGKVTELDAGQVLMRLQLKALSDISFFIVLLHSRRQCTFAAGE